MLIEIFFSIILLILSIFAFLCMTTKLKSNKNNNLPKSYPIFGSYFALKANIERLIEWIANMVRSAPTATITLYGFYQTKVVTGNPANVQHMLKTNFHNYQKGEKFRSTLFDFLGGTGIFNADAETWKVQRQVASHNFNTRSLRKFVATVVDTELSDRLIPVLSKAAINKTVLDFEDILQRFAFDNICNIAFGYDPKCLSPSLPPVAFAEAFELSVKLSAARSFYMHPLMWKIKRFLGVGSEKYLKETVSKVRDFAKKIVKEKKEELRKNSRIESMDLLSRFLMSGHSNDDDVVDVVISFTLAGRDTTSAALTWYFWLLSKNPTEESKILKEIQEKPEAAIYEEVKDMIYTHASLCESMRLYPPVPVNGKIAMGNDVFPDGTVVKKGSRVNYHIYAMGRLESIWGKDWEEFKPERWLSRVGEKWSFVGRDVYSYPVFHAGPRVCLGREMAFLQMKRVVAGVLSRFKAVPVAEEDPVFVAYLTAKMKGGFPVRIEERNEI